MPQQGSQFGHITIFSVIHYPPLVLISFCTNLESKLSPLWDFFHRASVLLPCAQAVDFCQRKESHTGRSHFSDSKPQATKVMQRCPASLHFPHHSACSTSETRQRFHTSLFKLPTSLSALLHVEPQLSAEDSPIYTLTTHSRFPTVHPRLHTFQEQPVKLPRAQMST